MSKKVLSMLLVIMLIIQVITPIETLASNKLLTIEEAVTLAIDNSEELDNAKINRIKKEIELTQAKEAIKDIRKKQRTIKFSLLFNIEFPEKHGLPKEIDLIMKVPQIESEIRVAKEEELYTRLKVKNEAEVAFYSVVFSEYDLENINKSIKDLESTLQKVKGNYAIGKGNKNDIEYIENELKNLRKEKDRAEINFQKEKERLSNVIGINVSYGYTFKVDIPTLDIDRSQLNTIIEYSLENDFQLYKVSEERMVAEREVDRVMDIYGEQFGSFSNDIISYVKSNDGRKIDYDEFMEEYNYTLEKIDSPWEGHYKIWLIFFPIYIPKVWFKGEYSGTRYFEDEKYALFISVVEREQARVAEKNAIEELKVNIREEYSSLKEMENLYKDAKDNLLVMQKDYKEAFKNNKLGRVSFTELESIRQSLIEQEKTLYEMQIEYAKSISSFDVSTSGFISNYLGVGVSIDNSYESGESLNEDSSEGDATWYVEASNSEYKFVFGVSIPEEYKVTHYELYSPEEILIGEKKPINDEIVHLPLTYQESTLFKLKLYDGNNLKYISYFDGMELEGVLDLQEMSIGSEEEFIVGTWDIEEEKYKSNLSVEIKEFSYDSYRVYTEDILLGEAKKGQSISHLKSTFSDPENLTIKLIYKEEETETLKLKVGSEGNRYIVYR